MSTAGIERQGLVVLFGFGTLSAIAGGIALLTGWIALPAEWLDDTIFAGYTIPALILAVIVGGSQLVALYRTLTGRDWTVVSGFAGAVMLGWIAGELLIVGSEPGLMRALQVVYALNGLSELALAALLLRQERAEAA